MFPHVAIVLYRIYPTSHGFLANVFRVACYSTFIGTIGETIVTMYLFGSLWNRWTVAFKIVTPVLHIAFAAAQLHGSMIFYKMWKKEQRLMRQDKNDLELENGGQAPGLVDASGTEERERSGAEIVV